MPRGTVDRIPSYRLHKQSGQAIVTLSGHDCLLGRWQSAASKREYERRIAEWLAAGRQLIDADGMTVAELLNAYRQWCEKEYRPVEGQRSSEAMNIRYALRPLRRLYGPTSANQFGPLQLRAVVEEYIGMGWTRKHINRQAARVRRFFKWAVANGFVPAHVHHGLQAVDGLRFGRSRARESDPVRAVDQIHVDAVRGHVAEQVWTMIQLQLLTAMRPGEVVLMRGCDIDTTGRLWIYSPSRHKSQYQGHARSVYIGPKAQAVLRPWLKHDLNAFLFSPAEAEAARRARLRKTRTTPLKYGNRPGTNCRSAPKKKPGQRYTRESYSRAVYAACARAFPYPDTMTPRSEQSVELERVNKLRREWRAAHYWSPNQLRHSAATRIRKDHGAEASQVILGHRQLRTTEVYAERDIGTAMEVMLNIG